MTFAMLGGHQSDKIMATLATRQQLPEVPRFRPSEAITVRDIARRIELIQVLFRTQLWLQKASCGSSDP